MSLKQQALSGVVWNALGKFGTYFIEFVVGIVLARLLSPTEFGIIGSTMIFIVISEVFVNSGFTQALVRKKECSHQDYTTVFYFNIIVGFLLFFILYISSDNLAIFLNNKQLSPIFKVLGLSLIISSFTIVQRAKLTRDINFKLQSKIQLVSGIISGAIAIILAFSGYGVWSLVVKILLQRSIETILLWFLNKWLPTWEFSKASFKELFGFGSKLLLSGIFSQALNNINHFIIAKYFSAASLGYFTRAESLKNLPSQNITGIVTSVGYPLLAKVQDDKERFKRIFKQMYTSTFFVICIAMIGMLSVSNNLILVLIGDTWLPAVPLLQLLCIVGVFYPLNSLMINTITVLGRSDLYLKLQFYTQLLVIPNIFIGLYFGMEALILGMIVITIFGYIIFNITFNKFVNYPFSEQLKDLSPAFILGVFMGFSVWLLGAYSPFNEWMSILLQVVLGGFIVIAFSELYKIKEYMFIKNQILSKFKKNA